MKKLFVSMGLIAAGTAGLQAAYAPGLDSMSASKVWSVSGTLRGFYDDNYATLPHADAKGSFGFEVSPQAGLNLALQQTELGARYTYGMYYYFDRGNKPIDQSHQFDLWLDHAFTERWQGKVQDSFVIGQEPELIGGGQVRRLNGDIIRNTANLTLDTIWTRLFSTELGYGNTVYDYQNSFYAGRLNRMEQSISLDLQWIVARNTTAFVGGMFGWADYTADKVIGQTPPPPAPPTKIYYSDDRNSRSYFGYAGVQHNLLANLSFNGRVGVQYTDEYNAGQNSVNPYANLSLIYTYLPGSYAQVGFTQTQNATDQVAPDSSGHVTLNQESSTLYASLNHKLTPKLMGTLLGRWQHSIYNGGAYNNQGDDYYSLGLNLSYSFNPHFSAEAGYNLDDVQSQISGNNYTRNRVYLGVSAAY